MREDELINDNLDGEAGLQDNMQQIFSNAVPTGADDLLGFDTQSL